MIINDIVFARSKEPAELSSLKAHDWLAGIPPQIQDVQAYFIQKGIDVHEADHFFLFYEKSGWLSRRGNPITKWKPFAWRWILSLSLQNPWSIDQRIR
jgi:hypothetical protein